VPPECAGDADEYVSDLIDIMLPEFANGGLCAFCDVFCETGVFSVAQSRRILEAARYLGLGLKIHADEIDAIGGAILAGELGAVSAEHLIATDGAGIAALAAGGVVAALLPATSLYLNKTFAPARDMIAAGVPVAVASDYNPGSCPSYNLELCANLAYIKYRMTPEEVLTAVTLNAACAAGLGARLGTAEVGKQGDVVLWDAPDLSTLVYRFGLNQTHTVVKKGVVIHETH
jgi:imidazolonepropionase